MAAQNYKINGAKRTFTQPMRRNGLLKDSNGYLYTLSLDTGVLSIYRSMNAGQNWSLLASLSNTYYVQEPDCVIDTSNNIHIVFKDGNDSKGYHTIFNGSTFSTPEVIFTPDAYQTSFQGSNFRTLLIDSNNYLYLMMCNAEASTWTLYCKKRTTSWQTSVSVYTNPYNSVLSPAGFTINSSGHIIGVIQVNAGGYVKYVKSTNGGTNWTTSDLSSYYFRQNFADLISDNSGNSYLVIYEYALSTTAIQFYKYNGTSWTKNTAITLPTTFGYAAHLTRDRSNNLKLFLLGRNSGSYDKIYLATKASGDANFGSISEIVSDDSYSLSYISTPKTNCPIVSSVEHFPETGYCFVYTKNSEVYIHTSDGFDWELSSVVAPTVTTQAATNVAQTSCTGNGNITATGGANATRRGFCYKTGTSGDPTVSDSVAYDDGDFGTGAFTKSITGLSAGTSYRVRAYAVNSAGTSYGATVDVKTLSAFKPRTTWF